MNKNFNGKKQIKTAFLVGGDPKAPDMTCLKGLDCDVIEIGIPFSDPVAEAPDIQGANLRALGCDEYCGLKVVENVVRQAGEISKETKVPVVVYTYFNLLFRYGASEFFKLCKENGVFGVNIADLPFEEKRDVIDHAREHNVALIPIVATTECERAAMIAAEGEGYIKVMPAGSREQQQAVVNAVEKSACVPLVLLG